ncbi:MAG TPA: phospho-sugar mutase, partial [Ruminococcus sp.]|nr:phospho-sugar mutase [Ruminococcus sp.]
VLDGKGGYALFSGNEVGAMLLEYICQQRIKKGTMPKDPVTVKTIVTTDIVNLIAKEYGVEVIDVLTGFKFIGEQIGFLESKGQENRYIFGFEESYGYLSGSYVRDKDAVNASMLICEMAAYYRTQGITLLQAREAMYKKYGYFYQTLYSFTFEGASGMKRMSEIMDDMRSNHPTQIGGLKVERFEDYKAGTSKNIATGEVTELTLPKSNVLAFYLEGGCKAIVRPSGTEPKIKTYITAKADSFDEAQVIEQKIYGEFTKSMK